LESKDVALVARAAETARHLRPFRVHERYRIVTEQIHAFGQTLIDAFGAHPDVDESTLLEMIFTDTTSCYRVDVPVPAVTDLIAELDTVCDDDPEVFHDLRFVTQMRWIENETSL
jgi:hypothetical protein